MGQVIDDERIDVEVLGSSGRAGEALVGDYANAIRTSVWVNNGPQNYLLFCTVELLPIQAQRLFLRLPNIAEKRSKAGRSQLVGMREHLAAEEAISWFKTCRTGSVGLVRPEGKPVELVHSQFLEEPPWPELVSAENAGWMASDWDCPRMSALLQESMQITPLGDTTTEELLAWIREYAGSDLSGNHEFLGAVLLVAPNPFVREIEHRLAPVEGGAFLECYRFVPQIGAPQITMRFTVGSIRPLGPSSATESEVVPGSQVVLEHSQFPEQTAYVLTCPERGVIAWHGPVFFIKSIHLGMSVISGKKKVVIPEEGKYKSESYTTDLISDERVITIRDSSIQASGSNLLRNAEKRRKEEKARSKQRWFFKDPEGATAFLQDIVSKARRKLIIVDPYSATRELFKYALFTSRPSVNVTILTSAECLVQKIENDRERGDLLEEALGRLKEEHPELSIDVMVMTGSRPAIHDRFVLLDTEAWMIGSSLNELGSRGGMALCVPYPDELHAQVERILLSPSTEHLPRWTELRRSRRE